MPPFKLASAGDDVKLWDLQSLDLLKQYNPHDHNVSALSWSDDATWLASVSALDNKVALTCVKNGSVALTTLDCEDGQTCIEYSSNSRYLLSGGKNGVIKMWDVKARKSKKSFKDHKSTVTCACFNWNDTSVASGSETGEIILSNVVSGFESSPLIAPKTQAVRQVQFKKSILGAVYDSGSVSLWDTNTRRLVHMFTNVHRAPATGIAFSPINEMLMMTIGLDKRMIMYDVVRKVTLNTLETDGPLTAIDVMHDGFTVAVGSTRGKVTLYDLRQGYSPITMFSAHKSSVQSLKFQPGNKSNQHEKSCDKIKEMNRRQLPLAPGDLSEVEPVKITNDALGSQTIDVAEQSGNSAADEDIFSPVREEGYNQSSSIELHNSDVNHSNVQNHSKSMEYNSSLQNLSQGVFSPIGRNSLSQQQKMEHVSGQLTNSIDDSIHSQRNFQHEKSNDRIKEMSRHQLPPATGDLTEVEPFKILNDSLVTQAFNVAEKSALSAAGEGYNHNQPSGIEIHNSDVNHSNVQNHSMSSLKNLSQGNSLSPQGKMEQIASRLKHSNDDSVHSQRNFQEWQTVHVMDSPVLQVREMVKDAMRTCNENMQEELKAMWRKANDQRSSLSRRDGSAQIESSVFQTEFLRGIIQEELEEFRAESHRDLQALHVEILKQFQIQQAEISSLIQHYSVNRELVAEIERLREENERLKKYY